MKPSETRLPSWMIEKQSAGVDSPHRSELLSRTIASSGHLLPLAKPTCR